MADNEQCEMELPELGLLLAEGDTHHGAEQELLLESVDEEVHHEAEYEPYHGAHPEPNGYVPLVEAQPEDLHMGSGYVTEEAAVIECVEMSPVCGALVGNGTPALANGHSKGDVLSVSPSNENEMEAIDLEVADYVPLNDCPNTWCTKDHVQFSTDPVPAVAAPVYRYPRPTGADPDPRTFRQARKWLCCLVMFCTVVMVALVCFSIYWLTRGNGGEDRVIVVDPKSIDPLYRTNCTHAWRSSTISQSHCELAGCWYVPDDPAVTYDVQNVPECFYPYPNYGYKVSSAVKVMDNRGMTTLKLRLTWKDGPVAGMIDQLEVKVNVKATLVEVLINKDNMNYSMANTAGESPVALSTVTVEYGREWFYLLITSSSGTTLLDTRASPLIYIEQSVIQLSSVLDTSYTVYNLNQDPFNMSYRNEVMEGSSNQSCYIMPAYIARKGDESFGVTFFGGAGKNEIYLTPKKSVTYTSWNSSSLSVYVFLGPTPNQVAKNMASKVRGTVAVPPSWMFELTFGESGATNHEFVDKHDEDGRMYREVSGEYGAKFSLEWSLFPTRPNSTGLCLQGLTSSAENSEYTVDGSSRWDTIPRTVLNTLNANMLGLPFTGLCSHSGSCGAQDNVSISLNRLAIWLPYTEIITDCGEGSELNADIQSAMELRRRLVPTWYALFYQSKQDQTGVVRLTSHSYPNDTTAASFDTELRQIMLRDVMVVPLAHLFRQGPVTSSYYLPTSERWFVSNGQQYSSVVSGQHNYTDQPSLTDQDQFFVRAGTALFTTDVSNEVENEDEAEGVSYHLTILLDESNKAQSVGDIAVTVSGSVKITIQGGGRDVAITKITIQDLKEMIVTPIPYKITYESVEGEPRVVQGQIEYEDVDESGEIVTLYHRLELEAAGVKAVTVVLETNIPQK